MGAAATTWESVGLAPPNTRIDEIDNGLDADEGVGIEFYGGYRLSPYVAFELEFEMIPDVDVDLGGSGKIGELETWAITSNMKMFVLTGRIQPYGLMGLGVLHGDLGNSSGTGLSRTDLNFAFRFGAGLDFYITKHIVVSAGADYVLPAGSELQDLDYVSFGGGI